jgi:phosphotransferase system  glucose/maltose/N-acetylglucosamine-specific IIC component
VNLETRYSNSFEIQGDATVSFRVAIAAGLSSGGMLIGSLSAYIISLIIPKNWSYFAMILICTVAYFIAVIYAKLFVSDTYTGEEQKKVHRDRSKTCGGCTLATLWV